MLNKICKIKINLEAQTKKKLAKHTRKNERHKNTSKTQIVREIEREHHLENLYSINTNTARNIEYKQKK